MEKLCYIEKDDDGRFNFRIGYCPCGKKIFVTREELVKLADAFYEKKVIKFNIRKKTIGLLRVMADRLA